VEGRFARLAMTRIISLQVVLPYENLDRAGRHRRFSIRLPGRRAHEGKERTDLVTARTDDTDDRGSQEKEGVVCDDGARGIPSEMDRLREISLT